MHIYPLKFYDIFKEAVWGNRNLAKVLDKKLPGRKRIGESWEIADLGEDVSRVENGPYKGWTLNSLCRKFPKELLGYQVDIEKSEGFPLLIKFLDSEEKLSVQVHPDDCYAQKNERGKFGKTEMWYVIHAQRGAQIVYGLKSGVEREQFVHAIESGKIEDSLKTVSVKPGDALFVPPGCVHSIGGGIIVYETQQSSDVTYRLYDWGRAGFNGKPRQLHIAEALDVIDFEFMGDPLKAFPTVDRDGCRKSYIAACRYFAIELITCAKFIIEDTHSRSFHALSALEGSGRIYVDDYFQGGGRSQRIRKGETVLIPAAAGIYTIEPDVSLKFIKTYVPDLSKDIISPLKAADVTRSQILSLGASHDLEALL